ncbi:UNVERIFIED_CONTAM: protein DETOXIFICATION 25 [Sesamum radiatum]|uniref:Protein DETOXIFICATION 25 n=1 Tax=Sesamum radiatum TaxID=300843 RepID=A0AAW2LBI6_SESRA
MDNGMREKLLTSEEREEGDLKGRVYDESKKIWRVALPGIIARVASFGTIIVTQSFIGHISSVDLAGYALVQTLTVRFANGVLSKKRGDSLVEFKSIPTLSVAIAYTSPLRRFLIHFFFLLVTSSQIGMSSATETLCGQAYGARQYHMMGVYLQRSWIVDFLTLTLLLPLFIFGAPIFKLFGEEAGIVESAGYISWWFIPMIYNFVFTLTMQMFLQAQQKKQYYSMDIHQRAACDTRSLGLFVYHLNWGVDGAMGALCISSWLVVFAELGYIMGGWCPQTWTGFSSAAFKDLLPVIKLSISSGVMVCLELWYNSVLVLLAGYMSNAEVAISAFSICLNINGWEFMICLGFLGAACVRIANELGRGDAKATKIFYQGPYNYFGRDWGVLYDSLLGLRPQYRILLHQ